MTDTRNVQRWVSVATLVLLFMLTVASVLNIHDMAEATHTANGLPAWIVSIAIGGTLSVLAYVASITDGHTRTASVIFAVFAATVSTALQVSLFIDRGAQWPVAVAFGVGVPFFEVALAITDSMLRRYETPVAAPVQKRAKSVHPAPVAPAPIVATMQSDAPPTIDTKNRAMQLAQEGMTAAQIARELDANYNTVRSWLKRASQPHLNGATGD